MGNLCKSKLNKKNIDLTKSLNSNNLGMYHIIQKIGSGAFGKIFIVKNMKSKKILAMKSLKKKRVIINEIYYYKLKLKHSNLIRYHEIFVENKEFYIIMDKYDSDMLDYLVENDKKIEEIDAKFYVSQILSGLKALEFYDYYHLDIKLENILINKNSNHIVLTDFGCMSRIKGFYEKINFPIGTKLYAAPEIMNDNIYTRNSDIWSLGVITFMMVKNYKLKNGYDKYTIELNCNDLTDECLDFLLNTLEYNFNNRLTISECLAHKWLKL